MGDGCLRISISEFVYTQIFICLKNPVVVMGSGAVCVFGVKLLTFVLSNESISG